MNTFRNAVETGRAVGPSGSVADPRRRQAGHHAAAHDPGQSPTPSSARSGGLHAAVLRQVGVLLALAFLALPALTPAAAYVRWLFPFGAAALAGLVYAKRRPATFVSVCVWLFLLTPFVRRVVDGRIGYEQANTLMLAPYLALAWTGLSLPRFFMTRGKAGQWPLAVLLVAVLYGFVLAIAHGMLLPGALDLLRWACPPLLAGYIIVHSDRVDDLNRELGALTLLALPLIGLYAVYQFVALPLWDAQWMLNSKMGSIGAPRPLEVRVFGTMNSPASLAYYLDALILMALCMKTPVRWLGVPLALAALAVTLVRSAWLGLAAGMLLLLVRSPLRTRASILALMAALVAVAPMALVDPRSEALVSRRIETLTNLGGDKSFTERGKAYGDALGELVRQPWGEGLGSSNVAANFTSRSRVIDGGPIEVLLSLGILAGVLYLAMAALLLVAAVARSGASGVDNGPVLAANAVLLAQALAFSSVTTTIGEIGVLFWLAVGLRLARRNGRAPRAARLS